MIYSIRNTKLDCMRQTTIKVCIAIQRWRPDWACWWGNFLNKHRCTRLRLLVWKNWTSVAGKTHSSARNAVTTSPGNWSTGIGSCSINGTGIYLRVRILLQSQIPGTLVAGSIVASRRWACADSSLFSTWMHEDKTRTNICQYAVGDWGYHHWQNCISISCGIPGTIGNWSYSVLIKWRWYRTRPHVR